MSRLMRFPSSVAREPAIERWMDDHPGELGAIARRWFEVIRGCGDDVRELLHDGHPTACVGDAAFAYVNAFTAHVNVGFFRGAELADPDRLLEGAGKLMRHVKLRPGNDVDASALRKLIRAAYVEMQRRSNAGSVRPFQPGDRPQLERLWARVFADDPPWNSPAVMIDDKLGVQPELLLVAIVEKDTVAGAVMAGYDGVRGWIYHLAVAPEHRRGGIATRLVRAAESGLRKLGCPKVNLQIRSGNADVVAFYRSLGYEVEQRVSMGRKL